MFNVSKKDIVWNYLATFFQIGSGVLLFPYILKMLPTEMIGIWAIFTSISTFVYLLDFGFSPSFTRNITYIFSGVQNLEKSGISTLKNNNIDYNLLANTIRCMKWYYKRIAIFAFISLAFIGSSYLFYITKNKYSGNTIQITIAWIIFCITNTYSIYTLYYDSLLLGAGLILKDKQFIIVSQIINVVVSIVLISLGFGLISIVTAQALAVVTKRFLSNRTFNKVKIKEQLNYFNTDRFKEILSIVSPNSIKLGITSIGAFLVLQSSIIIGSFYVTLNELASYGITMQLIGIVTSLSAVYYTTHIPQLSNYRVMNALIEIKKKYIRSIVMSLITFTICGFVLLNFGNITLKLLGAQTLLVNNGMIVIILIIAFLEKNHSIAGGFLLSKNDVPFFKAAIISGLSTVLLLYLFLNYFNLGLWGMILAPGLAQLAYQNWKWPTVLVRELKS